MTKNLQDMFDGRITKGVGGLYTVLTHDGRYVLAKPRGVFRNIDLTPYPGDYVKLEKSGDPDVEYVITEIAERKNRLLRPALANLDKLIIVISLARPMPDYHFIDKMLILAEGSRIEPVLVFNKADLKPHMAQKLAESYKNLDYKVFISGFDTDDDLKEIKDEIKGYTVSFAGLSGVGKSTLLNKLSGTDLMDVGKVSHKNYKGRHTTRHSELFAFNGGFIADTPGFSNIELTEADIKGKDVAAAYPEIKAIEGRCLFADCRHFGEKGCALKAGDIDPGRYERYKVFRELVDSMPDYMQK